MSDTDQPPMSKSVVKRLQAQGAEPPATKPVVAERACLGCGHGLVNGKGECRQCIDWKRHVCVFPAAEGGGEVELPCPPRSPSGKLWHEWFDRCGEHATLDVVNATATLVIEEKKLMDDTRTSQPADEASDVGCTCNHICPPRHEREIDDEVVCVHADYCPLSDNFAAQPLPTTEARASLTDAEVDAILEEHKDNPVDESQLERVRTMFNQKLDEQVVEDFIRSLPWSDSATEDEKTLVAGNIRGFAGYLRAQPTPTDEVNRRARAEALEEAAKVVDVAGTKWADQARDRKSKTYAAYVIAALDLQGQIRALITTDVEREEKKEGSI